MPGERRTEDETDLIRTEYKNLESADWWRAQKIDGLVLYAWGRPKFHKVAKAIQDADIFLILNLDSGGLMSPLVGWRDWLQAQWNFSGQGRGLKSWISFGKMTLHRLIVGLLITERLRAKHLRCGDIVGCVSPGAADYIRRLCLFHGGEELANRVKIIPHSVESSLQYSGDIKRNQIACIGRWKDQAQKRTWLLADVIDELLCKNEEVEVVIAGEPAEELKNWHQKLPESHQKRVKLAGIIGREELVALLDESRIFYSPSAFESFGIAAGEGLCSGCSVVAGRSVTMTAFEWFVSENSGQLAQTDDRTGHVEALVRELSEWNLGARNPTVISKIWTDRLHADNVAKIIVDLKSD